jgi:serine/threonine protein kinase
MPLQTGLQPFPGYRLRELRGRGGYAEVWEADAPDGRKVALKFLSGVESVSTPREIRAIEAVRNLNHPNLIKLDFVAMWSSKHESYIVICMELAEASVLDLLDAYMAEFHTPIVAEHACMMLSQVANALDFMNTRQHHIDGKVVAIRHCDVKPSNMLLFGDTIKLTDYGLATVAMSNLQPHRRAGTLDYAAPEVFQGRISDNTDQYALAVSYCQIRTNQLPFHDTPKSFDRKYTRPVADLSLLRDTERPIVTRALAQVPQDRWPSCRDFIAELTKVSS